MYRFHAAVKNPQTNSEAEKYGLVNTSLDQIFSNSDILTLHCPLTPDTYHIINADSIKKMKPKIMLINTGRGGLIDTIAVVDALKKNKIGYLGLDVYEEEANLFFEDVSDRIILDDTLSRLLTMPNVLVTSHMGFFTENALQMIAKTTLQNLWDLQTSKKCKNTIISCEF